MSQARILVVDDDESIREVFKMNLETHGHIVETAATGKEAIDKISSEFYNLALIDIRLPDMDGIDILSAIEDTNPTLIKIIVTGFPSKKNAIDAVNKGANGYLLKPVNMDKLLEVVEKHLEKQRKKKELDREKSDPYEISNRELKSQLKFYEPIGRTNVLS